MSPYFSIFPFETFDHVSVHHMASVCGGHFTLLVRFRPRAPLPEAGFCGETAVLRKCNHSLTVVAPIASLIPQHFTSEPQDFMSEPRPGYRLGRDRFY